METGSKDNYAKISHTILLSLGLCLTLVKYNSDLGHIICLLETVQKLPTSL